MVNTPDPLEERSRELFDDSVERLDARTRSRLNQARQQALEEAKKGRVRRYWLGAPLGGLAAAALIAVIVIRSGGEAVAPSGENASNLLDDFDIVADADSFELIQDVEFYSWLADQSENPG
ncbi:hypothetical protein ACFPN2_15885 [Steroidobacter flavus]|uniref:DUF3619 family protein n=1 Tax=Steroidobacter flavus TaxID=1842136 RepID=A0ABV8SUE2_9GAMM